MKTIDAAAFGDVRGFSTGTGALSFARSREDGTPAVIGIPSFRPVALRPRLSTGLPLSLNPKCQIAADRSQERIVCRGSQVVSHIGDTRACGGLCSPPRRSRLPETTRACEMPRINAAGEIAVRDRDAGARRVNEATRARVDPHVIDAASADVKEHQIAG